MEQKKMSLLRRQDSTLSIQQLSEKYKAVIDNNFDRKENKLVQQLFDEAKRLKEHLAFFKKQTSQQNIEQLILERRREKEKKRQTLEAQWRQCTESYKKLQEEQKRLSNQQKENEFDLKNIENKIKKFEVNIEKTRKRLESLERTENHFVTEVKQNYQSPYKPFTSVQEKVLSRMEEEQKLLTKTQEFFFTNKYNILPIDTLRNNSKALNCEKSSLMSSTNILKVLRNTRKFGNSESLKWEREDLYREEEYSSLWNFLSNEEIRSKIFKFLKRQI